MSHAEICPVCQGSGQVRNKDYGKDTGEPEYISCHGCFGKGWVEVNDYYHYSCYPDYLKPDYYWHDNY